MPVRRVKGGFKWGKHGKVYKSRKKAARQGQAAYANGYRGDGIGKKTPYNRALASRLASKVRILEGKTVAEIRRIWRKEIVPPYVALAEKHARPDPSIRRDASQVDVDLVALDKEASKSIAHVRAVFDKMGKAQLKISRQRKKILGIPEHGHPSPVQAAIEHARETGVQLVEKARRSYAQDVREIFTDPEKFGVSVEDLKQELLDRGNVWESRAELVARDQTLKLNGQIAQAEQHSAGIDKYIWSTSLDERVRETHRELEGKVIDWLTPPDVGHPGQDFQCRCIAMPVLDEQAGD